MIIAVLLIILGGLLLFSGGEMLIRGSVALALRLHLQSLVIGLTIVAYGTGIPEVVVSMQASLLEKSDLAVGNALGSNIVNCGLILGLSAFLIPLPVSKNLWKIDIVTLLSLSLICTALLYLLPIWGRTLGVIFLLTLVLYTYFTLKRGKKDVIDIPHVTYSVSLSILFIIFGLFLLGVGGHFFVEGAVILARALHVSEAFIGLTVVALGTSLPELATCMVAIYKKQTDLVLGNIIGSSIFNILAILGASALVKPLDVSHISWVDGALMTFFVLTIFFWGALSKKISRIEGVILLVMYGFYVFLRYGNINYV